MRCRVTILLLSLLIFYQNGPAQALKSDTFSVFTYGQEQGLSQLNALAMDFDSLGYLWIGTENGLNRFNGYSMKTYMAGDKVGDLIDDHIRAMYYAKDTLWLATDSHSLVAYLPKKNKFINFLDQLDFNLHPYTKYTNLLYPIDNTYLLLGTNGNCLLFDRHTKKFTIIPLPANAKNDFITSCSQLNEDQLLIGTNNHGLLLLDIAKRSIQTRSAYKLLTNATINSIYPYSTDLYLIATENRLYWLNSKTQSISLALKDLHLPEITSIQPWETQDGQPAVFLSAINHGYILNQQKQVKKIVFQNLQKENLSAEVKKILKDPQGGFWLGTNGRGVFYYHPRYKKFTPLRIKTPDAPRQDFISIFNFLRVGNRLWMATEFGFASYNLQTQLYKFYPSSALEYTLAKDANGTIWGGGFGQGLVRYDPEKDGFIPVIIPIEDKDVIQVTPIDKDFIWVHTWSNGIFAFNVHTQAVRKLTLNKNTLVRSRTSFKDHLGNIWIGSDDGIYKIKGDSIQHLHNLSNERVFDITEDPSGNIWVGTAKGLNRISPHTDSTISYTKASGLPNDFIYGVLAEDNGNIWCSTNYGISRYNPATNRFRNYTETDGLQNNEFNGKAAYKDDQGNLYFGGMNGFNFFDPRTIYTNKQVGKTVIEDIQVFGKSIAQNLPYLKALILSHDQNVISFEYTALNYLWANKNLYQFMLEGFDKDWRNVTDFRSTTYTNLDPGNYTFKVRGSNNDGVWGAATSLKVIIKGPWYKSLWFKVLLAATLLIIILGVFMYKSYRQKLVNKKLLTMVEDRTSALQKSNQELNESLALSERQKENITFLMRELNHRVKNNLQIITSLIDIQDLSIANPKAKSKLKLLQSRIFTVSRIHDILTNTEEKEEIRIDQFLQQLASEIIAFSGKPIALTASLSPVKYPVEKLTYLGLILNELITNSIKHAFGQTAQPEISIHLTRQADKLQFIYKDNGTGFKVATNEDSNEKMGVNLVKFLAKELNGILDFSHSCLAEISLTFANQTKNNEK
ncbi:hypothetical protein GCM10027566_32700 [Arachidicoccus ginsenosidivorans]|nr:two-component regulator propeller domain-containing protein [Arachidicoccus ginsenosidivorans]